MSLLRLLIFSFILFFFISCVKELPVSPENTSSKFVLTCLLTNEDVQKLTLTKSKAFYSGNNFEDVPAAIITLYEDEKEIGFFTKSSNSEWQLTYKPIPGKKYQIVVEVAGNRILKSTTTMPEKTDISFEGVMDENATKIFSQQSHASTFWMFILQSTLDDPIYSIHPPTLEEDPFPRLSFEIGTDHQDADRFNQEGSAVEFIPEFGNTLAYKYYVRITPNAAITKQTPYRFRVQHRMTNASFIVFRHVSSEYDKYLKTICEKKSFYESEDDPAKWFDENIIYSNIENGLGIFGAYIQESYYYNNTIINHEKKTN